MHISFINKTLYTIHSIGFLSVKQSKAALLGHNKTPDGKFSGDRMMSRYEFAAMLYRAMQKGAQLDSKIINEFAPEMGRIRVDRISGEDGDRDKIERVRVNAVKGERDHYGNKIAKAEAKAK